MCPANFYDLGERNIIVLRTDGLNYGRKDEFWSIHVELHAAICFSEGYMARVEGLRILHVKASYVLARLGG